jgi:predicted acetyltransferase
MAVPALRLRPPAVADEQTVREAHALLAAEGFVFGLGLDGRPWRSYLDWLATVEAGQAPWVPASFLLAEVDGVIVGRTSIRHRLDEQLAVEGGHIGYCVLPAHRRRGHATEILRQSLTVAHHHGVTKALLTCDETNLASQKVIEHCGGALESTNGHTRRYWIG